MTNYTKKGFVFKNHLRIEPLRDSGRLGLLRGFIVHSTLCELLGAGLSEELGPSHRAPLPPRLAPRASHHAQSRTLLAASTFWSDRSAHSAPQWQSGPPPGPEPSAPPIRKAVRPDSPRAEHSWVLGLCLPNGGPDGIMQSGKPIDLAQLRTKFFEEDAAAEGATATASPPPSPPSKLRLARDAIDAPLTDRRAARTTLKLLRTERRRLAGAPGQAPQAGVSRSGFNADSESDGNPLALTGSFRVLSGLDRCCGQPLAGPSLIKQRTLTPSTL